MTTLRVYAIDGIVPVVDPTAYVHPSAVLIGDVIVGPGCYVGPCASLRGDFGRLILERGANLQDTCVMHGFPGTDTVVEEDGHIGHGAVLHGCRIGRNALVGMNAVIMDNAVVGESSIVAASAFVKAGAEIPPQEPRRRHAGQGHPRAFRRGDRLEGRRHPHLPGPRPPQPGDDDRMRPAQRDRARPQAHPDAGGGAAGGTEEALTTWSPSTRKDHRFPRAGLYSNLSKLRITMRVDPLSLAAQTAYAQVLEAALAAEHLRSVADLPARSAPRRSRDTNMVLPVHRAGGRSPAVFVGPDNDPVQALMPRQPSRRLPNRSHLSSVCRRARLRRSPAAPFPRAEAPADYGFFKAGGVLIGTHAFIAYGNMLGIRWGMADAARTQDIDFAHAGKSISLALAPHCQVQTHEAIQSLEMGFLPITGLAGKTGGAYLIPREKEFRLDFLTTIGRSGDTPYEHPDLHVTLQPLRFMEYSLENVSKQACSGPDAVIVNVPTRPATPCTS